MITAEPLLRPVWHILQPRPQAELPCIAWLASNGVAGAWCPTETRWRNIKRGRRKRIPYEAVLVPGYLFVPFTRRPVWHEIRERSNGRLRRVVTQNGKPYEVPEQALLRMQQVPGRLAAMRNAEIERKRIRTGDKVEIQDGNLAGWTIEVSEIAGPILYFLNPFLGGGRAKIEADRVAKIG